MSMPNRHISCKYLITEDAKKPIRAKRTKSKSFQCFDEGAELFYFPISLKSEKNKREIQGRTFLIDPWPAYASDRTKTTSQVLVDQCGHLKRQNHVESKLSEPHKPMLLLQIEEKMYKDRINYKIPDDPTNPVRLQMFREVFDMFINSCVQYKPFLSQIKSQYDHYISFLHQKVQEHLPLLQLVNTVSLECENRIKLFRKMDNKEIKHLEATKQQDFQKIETLKLETAGYKVLVNGLESKLMKETKHHMIELNGRKLALQVVNELSDQVIDMGNAFRTQAQELEEDPVKLRLAVKKCSKAREVVQQAISEYDAQFESNVPLAKMEEMEKKLQDERELNAQHNDELVGMTNRYDLLQEHFAALTTYRDLYQVQCQYVLRVIGSKSEVQQKTEYIGLLLNKWRRLITEKPIDDLTRLAHEEILRYETGGIPPISRMNRNKRSLF